jgi:hypothetical protein
MKNLFILIILICSGCGPETFCENFCKKVIDGNKIGQTHRSEGIANDGKSCRCIIDVPIDHLYKVEK